MAHNHDANKGLQTVGRAAELLAAFRIREAWSLSELATYLSVSKSMTHRLLHTLANHELVTLDIQSRRYRIGQLVHDISYSNSSGSRVLHVARHLIEEAAAEIDETIAFCRLQGRRGVCLVSQESRHSMRMSLQTGEAFALNAGAIGKVLLAHQDAAYLDEFFRQQTLQAYTDQTITDPDKLRIEFKVIHACGVAYSTAEITPDASSVSIPIFGTNGRVRHCLAASGPTSRFTAQRQREAEIVLKRIARQLSFELEAEPEANRETEETDVVQ